MKWKVRGGYHAVGRGGVKLVIRGRGPKKAVEK